MDAVLKRIPGAVVVISNLNGFKAYYVVRGGDDTVATVSVFTDKTAAVQSNQTAAYGRWLGHRGQWQSCYTVFEIDTLRSTWFGDPIATLGSYGRRRFENWVILERPKERLKILYR